MILGPIGDLAKLFPVCFFGAIHIYVYMGVSTNQGP